MYYFLLLFRDLAKEKLSRLFYWSSQLFYSVAPSKLPYVFVFRAIWALGHKFFSAGEFSRLFIAASVVFRTCILIYFYLQQLPLTRVLGGGGSPCWKLSFHGRQSTVSMVFSCTLTEKFPSSLNERQRLAIISHDDSVYNVVYFIKMKDYIVKTMRSLQAAWNSRNTL